VALPVIFAALLVAGLGELLKQFIIRHWAVLCVNPRTAIFPKLCPVCLSDNASSTVDEKSIERRTANYVVAHKTEWWKASVPHCTRCADMLLTRQFTGSILGALCALATLLLVPPSRFSFGTLCYVLFGYPAYAVLTTMKKGVIFGTADRDRLQIYVRHLKYRTKLAELNRSG
jgi:hypothetical protein